MGSLSDPIAGRILKALLGVGLFAAIAILAATRVAAAAPTAPIARRYREWATLGHHQRRREFNITTTSLCSTNTRSCTLAVTFTVKGPMHRGVISPGGSNLRIQHSWSD